MNYKPKFTVRVPTFLYPGLRAVLPVFLYCDDHESIFRLVSWPCKRTGPPSQQLRVRVVVRPQFLVNKVAGIDWKIQDHALLR